MRCSGLTGPVARGDAGTLEQHLRVLGGLSRSHEQVHRLLSERLLALAETGGRRLSPASRRRLRAVLSAASGGRRKGPTV